MIQHSNLYHCLVRALKYNNMYVTKDNHLKIDNIQKALKNHKSDVIGKIYSAFSLNKRLRHYFIHTFQYKNKTLYYLDITSLKQLLSEYSYISGNMTKYIDRIGLSYNNVNHEFVNDNSNIVLNFPYKDCYVKGGMTKDEAKDINIEEPFLNNIAFNSEINEMKEPKIFIDAKKYFYDSNQHKVVSHPVNKFTDDMKNNIGDSLFVKGNNLEALYSLLHVYRHQVKLIYIDPPFNTGSDSFKYNDSFSHSTWLTFMENRLKIAKKFLAKDGMIFVNIDNNESAYLKVLMDEIFDRKNYISSIYVKTNTVHGVKTQNKNKTIIQNTNVIHVYARNKKIIKNRQSITPQYTPKDQWDTHYSYFLKDKNGLNLQLLKLKDLLVKKHILKKSNSMKYILRNNKFIKFVKKYSSNICRTINSLPKSERKKLPKDNKVHPESNNRFIYNGNELQFLNNSFHNVYGKQRLAQLLGTSWTDIDFQNTQNEGGVPFPGGKKPERLLKRIISMATNKNDIVMDFFAGSATTQAVALKMDRRFIGVEQMNYPINKNNNTEIYIKRLCNVINGDPHGISKDDDINWYPGKNNCSFIYAKLMNKNQFIINKINIIKESKKITNKQKLEKLQNIYYKILFNRPFNVNYSSIGIMARINPLSQLFNLVIDDEDSKSSKVKKLKKYFYGVKGVLTYNNKNITTIKVLKSVVKKQDSHNCLSRLLNNLTEFIIRQIRKSNKDIKDLNNTFIKFNFPLGKLNLCMYIRPIDLEYHFTNINKISNYLIGILDKNQNYYSVNNIKSDVMKHELTINDLKFNENIYHL